MSEVDSGVNRHRFGTHLLSAVKPIGDPVSWRVSFDRIPAASRAKGFWNGQVGNAEAGLWQWPVGVAS